MCVPARGPDSTHPEPEPDPRATSQSFSHGDALPQPVTLDSFPSLSQPVGLRPGDCLSSLKSSRLRGPDSQAVWGGPHWAGVCETHRRRGAVHAGPGCGFCLCSVQLNRMEAALSGRVPGMWSWASGLVFVDIFPSGCPDGAPARGRVGLGAGDWAQGSGRGAGKCPEGVRSELSWPEKRGGETGE